MTEFPRKHIRSEIRRLHLDKNTNQEIYDILVKEGYDKRKLALLINAIARPTALRKFNRLHCILISLVAINTLFEIWFMNELYLHFIQNPQILFHSEIVLFWPVLFYPLLNLGAIAWLMFRQPLAYRATGLIALINGLMVWFQPEDLIDILLSSLFSIAISLLSFYILSKLYPNHGVRQLRTDDYGNYIMED